MVAKNGHAPVAAGGNGREIFPAHGHERVNQFLFSQRFILNLASLCEVEVKGALPGMASNTGVFRYIVLAMGLEGDAARVSTQNLVPAMKH
jgi:hypothetical protein